MIQIMAEWLGISPERVEKIFTSLVVILVLWALRLLAVRIINRRIADDKRRYYARRTATYFTTTLLLLAIGSIWVRGIASLSTFLGLASAGLAVALHDTIANIAGFFFITSRKPFRVGDRIQLEQTHGDVIDIRLFQFSVVEIGEWVGADQSTGRIIHVPNSLVLRHPLANYHIGFEYIWNEIPVLVTFESDWKKSKRILLAIAKENAEYLSNGAQEQIRRAARKYMIVSGVLTPTVYTSVRESGVLLTIRYLVNPRQRRGTEEKIWEAVLEAFAQEPDIDLAYPTTRFYAPAGEGGGRS